MSDFVETVKRFFSQRYSRVYDEGQLLDVESLEPSHGWHFHIHGLDIEKLEYLEQEEFVDEFVYQLRFGFYLEGIHIYLREVSRFDRMPECMAVDAESDPKAVINQLPDSVWESYDFYYNNVQMQDWGNVYAFRVTIEGQDTLVIRVTTDGSDGWLEVFDNQGHNLASARTSGNRIAWRSTNLIRQQVYNNPRCPPELD